MYMLKDKIKITHLVLSGGGSHGSVQVGALRFLYLENMHHNVTHIACCSIGCFVAVMFIFKFTIEEMEDTIREVIIYKDFTFIPKSRYLKIISDFGLTDTTKVTDMLIKKIRTKYPDYDIENMTFIDIAKRFGINLYISATNLNTKMNKIFCVEDTPNELVFSALHASICIPFLFKPVDIDGEYYIDGGMTNNFPISLFSNIPDENILGLALCGELDEIDYASEENTKIKVNFFFIIQQILSISRNIIRKDVLLQYVNRDYVLQFHDVPVKWFNYEITKDGLEIFKLTNDEVNEMFIYGFNKTFLYMMEREKMVDTKILALEQIAKDTEEEHLANII
jgi:hypothetical protein